MLARRGKTIALPHVSFLKTPKEGIREKVEKISLGCG